MPEEQLGGGNLGVLGRPRADFDCLLNPAGASRHGSASDVADDGEDDFLRRWSTLSQLGGRGAFSEVLDLPDSDPLDVVALEAFPTQERRSSRRNVAQNARTWARFARGDDAH